VSRRWLAACGWLSICSYKNCETVWGWEVRSQCTAYSPRERLWIDSNFKNLKTRHPVGGPFSRDFSLFVIIAELMMMMMISRFVECVINGPQTRVMTAWSRKTLKFCEKFLRVLEIQPLMVKFAKFCSKSLHGDTDRRCCVEMS